MEVKIDAKFDDDTKRMHRFLLKPNQYGIVGTIYVGKDSQVPDTIIIELKTLSDEKK